MSSAQAMPRFIDEHRVAITAPRERVWEAVREYFAPVIDQEEGGPLDRLLFRALKTEPRTGFTLTREEPGLRLELEGRHRFSRYRFIFELRDADGGATELAALTFADFPGVKGRAYKALVIGSRGHAVAVRGMLRSIRKASGAR